MGESKVLSQGNIHDLDSHCDESPAPVTDRCAGTACTYVIVICHINVEYQLFHKRAECTCFAEALSISWVCAVHGTNFKPRRQNLYALFAKHIGRGKGLIS